MAQDYGLHISNFPYWFSRRDIAWCITERFAYPSKVTPLWSGPSSAPYRRMSAFVHWSRHGPSPGEVSGWLPEYMRMTGWNIPLYAHHITPPAPPHAPQQHLGSTK